MPKHHFIIEPAEYRQGHPLTENAKIGLLDGLRQDAFSEYEIAIRSIEEDDPCLQVHLKALEHIQNKEPSKAFSCLGQIVENNKDTQVPESVWSWITLSSQL